MDLKKIGCIACLRHSNDELFKLYIAQTSENRSAHMSCFTAQMR